MGDLGKIMWSFIKPLVMGKVLYAPTNEVTNAIMHEVGCLSCT